jgi:hypothetical protein
MTTRNLGRDLKLGLDPGFLLRAVGMTPDPWQEQLLRERPRRGIMLCCRQAGKSLTAAAASLHEAIYQPDSLILMIAPAQRQSAELLRKTRFLLNGLPDPPLIVSETTSGIELGNGSRILSLPATEDTIRGYSAVSLIVLDEASRVPDELYFALRPMLATSDGRLLALSTPNGQRGWFYHAWISDQPWKRVKITASECPRIRPAFLEDEQQNLTPAFYASEYECVFGDTVDSVFFTADIEAALDDTLTPLYPQGWK